MKSNTVKVVHIKNNNEWVFEFNHGKGGRIYATMTPEQRSQMLQILLEEKEAK